MREPIEYQHFANLVERVAVVTERLENVCKTLEQYKMEMTTDIKDLDNRVRTLENKQNNHSGRISGGWLVACICCGVVAFAATNFIYIHMANWGK